MEHGAGESVGVVLTGKVKSINLLVVAPLMERDRGLIVLESFKDGAIDNDLMVLEFSPNDAKGVVHLMMIELDLGESRRGAARYPFLVDVVVDHNRRTSG